MNPARWPPIHFTVALSYCLFGWKKFLNLNWNYFFKNQTKEKHFSQSFTDSFGYLLANRVAPLGIKLAIGDQKIWSRHLRCLEFLSSSLLVVFLRTRTDFQSAFQNWMSTSLPSRFCYYRQLSVLSRTLKLLKVRMFFGHHVFRFFLLFLAFWRCSWLESTLWRCSSQSGRRWSSASSDVDQATVETSAVFGFWRRVDLHRFFGESWQSSVNPRRHGRCIGRYTGCALPRSSGDA